MEKLVSLAKEEEYSQRESKHESEEKLDDLCTAF